MTSAGGRNRRADAQRSRASVLDAAVDLLGADPKCSIEAIAASAGVTRQTVYAHFPSRKQLLDAAFQRATDAAVAALDAVDLDSGSATEAMLRLLDTSAQITEKHRPLFRMANAIPVSPAQNRQRHALAVERLKRVIMRGQRSGDFDDQLSADWLATVIILMGHAAGDEADAGSMARDEATATVRTGVLRVLGATTPRAPG